MKKKLAATLSVVLILGLAVLGILAYLTDTDNDVNVMTLGNVDIEQIEQERGENGEFQEFTGNNKDAEGNEVKEEGKPLFPATPGYKDNLGKEELWHNENNAVDKIVSVKNTGKSEAYVRTWFAFEYGNDEAFKKIDINKNETEWSWSDGEVEEIDGKQYYVMYAVYNGALASGSTTEESLRQVALLPEATNDDVAVFGDTYKILVFTQAVQTAGFEADTTTYAIENTVAVIANNALNTAFAEAHPWGLTKFVDSAQSLKDAMLVRDGHIILEDDITVDANTPLQWGAYMFVANGREVTIDLNGHDIIVEDDALLKTNAVFTTANGGTLNIIGDGTIEVKNGKSGIFHAMNKNDQINVWGGTFISNSNNGSDALAIIYTNSGNVDVYGGKFIPFDGIECANAEDAQGNRLSIVFHEGTLLKHSKYYAGLDATRIQLEEGCELKETEIDGVTWYQVVKK